MIAKELDLLSDFQAHRDVIAMNKQAMIDSVLTPEIRAQIAEIEAEFAPQLAAADEAIALQTEHVKDLVVGCGMTVKGTFLQAVYAKGRVSWDTKALDGYMVAHPEIAAMRKQGEPSVSIRKI